MLLGSVTYILTSVEVKTTVTLSRSVSRKVFGCTQLRNLAFCDRTMSPSSPAERRRESGVFSFPKLVSHLSRNFDPYIWKKSNGSFIWEEILLLAPAWSSVNSDIAANLRLKAPAMKGSTAALITRRDVTDCWAEKNRKRRG